MIIGVLSLIAVVATTSTLSAYALSGQDVAGIVNDFTNEKSNDLQKFVQQTNPLDDKSVKDLANKISNSIPFDNILGQTTSQKSTDISDTIPSMSLPQ